MTKVVLVCVAGVSGTFLARRMRDLDTSLVTSVATLDTLPAAARASDAILVAPQLAAQVDAVASVVGAVPIAILPASAYGVGGADAAVRTVHELLGAAATSSSPVSRTTSGKKD